MTGCRFHLLGGLKIIFNDEELTLMIPGGKAKLLLAYLVLASDMPQSRKQIAFDFWPDSTDKQALSNLRKLLHDLRQFLPQIGPYLKITPTYIQWNHELPFYSDVSEFEKMVKGKTLHDLRKAEELYGGELLPGFYEEWVGEKREQLKQTYLNVLDKLISILDNQREYSQALFFANKLLLQNTLREETYCRLMRLHALNKDMSGVKQIYRQLCNVLQSELGINPAEETLQLLGRLTQNGGEKFAVSNNPTPFIGRISEWEDVLSVWEQTTVGRNTLLILMGESGIGKTRLVLEFQSWVESQGGQTAFAGCYPSGTSLSYTPVTTWLRSLPLPQISLVWLSELARLLPELRERYPDLPMPNPVQENWQLKKWYEAIEQMLLANQPLLLILDNIQWSDRETFHLLSYLLRSDSKAKLLIIATMRTDELTNDVVGHFISGLRIDRKLMEIELAPFSEAETKRLLAATIGDALADVHSAGLHTKTGGIPLFIVESLKEWQTGSDKSELRLSPLVKTLIETRINRLSSENRQLVSAIAAVGRPVSTSLMSIVLDMEEEAILDRMEQLLQLKVIREDGKGQYDFTHDIVREIAYKLINDSKRRQYHLQIARGLLAHHHSQPEFVAAEIAFHYELAGVENEAAVYYEMAALAAEKIYANETRIKYYQKLCTLLPPEQILPFLMKLGEAWIMAGDWNEAERTYRHWLERSGYSVTIRERSLCDIALGDCLRLQGRFKEAQFHLERARRHFERMEDHSGLHLVCGALGVLHYYIGNNDKALHYLMGRIEMSDFGNRTREDCRVLGILGGLFYNQCEYDRAIQAYSKQFKLATESRDMEAVGKSLGGLALVYLDIDQTDQAFDCIVEKMEISQSIGDRMGLAIALGMLGKYYGFQGSHTLSAQCIAYCLEEAVAVKDWRFAANLLGWKGHNLLAQGQDEEALLWIDRSLRLCRQLRVPYFECNALYLMSELSHHQKRYENAVDLAKEALNIADRLKRRDMQCKLHVQLLHLKTGLGQITPIEAVDQLQRMLEQYPDQQEEATIRYAMWQQNPGSYEHRSAALLLNEELYRKSGKEEYLVRCREMNGSREAAAARPMPQLAAELTQHKRISPNILTEIDRFTSS